MANLERLTMTPGAGCEEIHPHDCVKLHKATVASMTMKDSRLRAWTPYIATGARLFDHLALIIGSLRVCCRVAAFSPTAPAPGERRTGMRIARRENESDECEYAYIEGQLLQPNHGESNPLSARLSVLILKGVF